MPGDLSDHGSVRPWIYTVLRDCFHGEIIAENNAYGVVFDSLRAAYLLPSLVLGMKGDTPKRVLNAVECPVVIDPAHVFSICCLDFRDSGWRFLRSGCQIFPENPPLFRMDSGVRAAPAKRGQTHCAPPNLIQAPHSPQLLRL